ncbi:histidine phosphatase family protein [Mycobacterium sp. 236(2023)]|uniref:histidine phosphatase family protein n=1 Tax=Mycobacterium sp. 236(2023) TaxID=3038163 RepID=UPI002414DCDE|nr:histidine phosphatase family protein [Mycobacterium sp. 236(2023)]MDG4667828.1 histidine phosphatase family protein [Mycobacterium sp. 236(2023)]
MNDASGPHATKRAPERRRSALWRGFGVALTALALLLGAAVPAAAAELMRVTFVRHGQSAGNASGLIDTSTPGPVLTPTGQLQSQAIVGTLGDNNYDAVYASTMVRTQLTAAPMSQYLGLPIQVLPGLQEIEAGVFEGTPESQAQSGYGLYPLAWAIQGNRDLRIPQSIDGNEFDARVDGALQTIYDNGDRNPVIFSHGGAIMFWTMMNVQNLTAAEKIDLLRTAPLSNTNYVIIEGNGEDGWTLVNWNGKLFSPEPTLSAEIRRQWRTLNRQLAASGQQFFDSFESRDFATIATAFNRSVADAKLSFAKYHRAIQAKVISDLSKKFAPPATEAPAVSAATVSASVETVAEDASPAVSESASEPEVSDEPLSKRSATRESASTEDDDVAKLEEEEDAVVDTEDEADQDTDTVSDVSEDSDTDDASTADSDTSDASDTDSGEGGGDSQRDAA